jgi:hypothetical protein
MQMGWVACPFCGFQVANMFNSNLPVVDLIEQSQHNCSGSCGKSKRVKSTCCQKHLKKKKYCGSCPKKAQTKALNALIHFTSGKK